MENIYEIDFKEVGARIRAARKKQGLTQARAAELALLTGHYWSRIEQGHERASVSAYRMMVTVVGLTLDDIFYDDAARLRLHKAFTMESIFKDCTVSERAILSEAIRALKDILVNSRSAQI